jgi:predicted DNA-binding transcriptional regulator AlpA
MSAKLLTAAECAAKLRIGVRHFRERYCFEHDFPAAFRPGGTGRPLWREDEVNAWIVRWQQAA